MGNPMGGGSNQGASGPVYMQDQQAQQMANQLRQQSMTQAMIDANRQRYMQMGQNYGQEIFGNGTLPRIQEGRTQEMSDLLAQQRALNDVAGQRSGEAQDVLNRQYAGLGGYTAPEYQALHQQAMQGFQNQVQAGQRDIMRQNAANRIYGGAAQAALQRFNQQANSAAANAEQQLMIQNINEQQNRLNAYGQNVAGNENTEWARQMQANQGLQGLTSQIEQDELARQQYNNQQAQKEKAGQLQATLGFAGLGAGDLSTGVRTALANQQMQSAMNSGNSGGSKGGGK